LTVPQNNGDVQIFYPQLTGFKDSDFEKNVNDYLYSCAVTEELDKWEQGTLCLNIDYYIHYADENYISVEFKGEGNVFGSRLSYVQYGVNLDFDKNPSLRMEISEIIDLQDAYNAIENEVYEYLGVTEKEKLGCTSEEFTESTKRLLESNSDSDTFNIFAFDDENVFLFIDARYPYKIKIKK